MKFRSVIALLLLLSLTLSLLPVSVFAAETRKPTLSTDSAFFGKLNLSTSELSDVKTAVSAGNYTEAKKLLLAYYKTKFASYNPGFATAAIGSVAVAAMEDTFTFSEALQSSVKVTYDATNFTEYAFALTKDTSAAYVLSVLDKTDSQVRICSSEHSAESVRPKLLCYDSSKKLIGTLSASADGYVDCGKPDTSYGTSTYLYAKDHYTKNSDGTYVPYGTKSRRTYIKFDTAQIPFGTKYTQLVIHARVEGNDTETVLPLYQFVSYWKTWTEDNLTWNYLVNNDGIGHYSWKGIPGGFDWTEPEGVSNQWYAYNSRFLQMTSLIQQGLSGNKPAYITKAKDLLIDFINDVTVTANWEYAGGIQSGNRLMEFPYIYKQLLAQNALTPDENMKILAWLYDEMVYMDGGGGLFNNADPSAHGDLVYTNQGFWLLVGFYCGFAYWPEFTSATQWKTRYVSREDTVLNSLIHKDGSFNEVTFGYPYNVLDWYQHLRSCMVELSDPTKSIDKMDRKFILLCAYLMYCAQSDHSSPNWGQGGAKDITIAVRTLLDTVGSAYDSNLLVQNLRFFLDPTTGTKPSTSAQFDGIKVITDRTGWTKDDSMIFMNAKCAGNHSHRDALALLFYYDGRELLTDTGMTSYSNKHTHYDWQNSISRSHNTIEIDGISQVLYQNLSDVENRGDIQLVSNDAVATVTAWTTANTNDTHTKSLSMDGVVNNKVYHKTDFTHYRNVSYLKALGDILIVTDKVVPGDSNSHSYTQNWHTEPYSKATVASDSYDTGKTAFSSGANLTIAQVSGNSVTPTIRAGYDSTAQSTTTTYFEYKQSASGTVTYQTLLYPTLQGQTVTLKPNKLTMSGTTDATARAFKASVTDSAQGDLKTLYYYNSFETTPSARGFDSYTTNAGTAALSLNSKSERTFASLSNGSFLRVASSSLPIVQTSYVVTDLSAYMEGANLYIESSDPRILTAGVRVNLHSGVQTVFLNGKAVAFTTDANGTVTLNSNALLLHFNEVSPLNTDAYWTPSTDRATAKVDTAKGILYGDITSYDPYIRADSIPSYILQEGDVVELRLKVTSTNSADKEAQVFFLTSDDSTWNSAKSKIFSNATVNQGYQTFTAPMPSNYVGKTLTALRIDPLNTDKTSTSTGTYEIDYLYIGAPENAPSNQADTLFFDFDSDERAYFRYQSPIYGGRNYDTGCWSVNEGRNSLPAYDTEAGTIQMWMTPTGTSPYFQSSNTLLDKTAQVLNYVPHKSDIMEVRFKLTDCAVVSGANPTIRMYYIKNNGSMGNSDYVPVAIPTEALTSGTFVTVRTAMTEAFTSATVINALRPTFNNICSAGGKTGSVTVDYIYIGAAENAPTKDQLYFGFENSSTDKDRYSSYVYGKTNFDDPANIHWIASAGATLKMDNSTGTLTLAPAKASDTMILYTEQNALSYDLSKAEVYQIRFRFKNVRVPSGKTPLITMDLYAGSQKVDMEDRILSTDQVTGGNFVTVTVPISAENRAAGIITKLQVYIGRIEADTNSSVEIDYIYLGSKANLPTPAYTVTFKDGNGSVLSTQLVTKGEEALYTGTTPTKAYDSTNHYSFKDWDKALTNITANTVITARFTATAHTYSISSNDTNTHKATCSCGYSKSENHTIVVDKAVAPTCTATGLTEGKHCSVCNAVLVKQETVAALGHSYTAKVTAPTCTAQGYTTHTCSRCSDTYKDTYVNAKGHTEVIDKAVAPTCTATGKTEGKHCSVCNTVLVKQETVAALGHSYTAKVTAPTCTAQGYTTHTCSRCSDTYKDTYVNAKGHTEVIDKAVSPTCTATGKTEGKHCSVCNAVLVKQETVAALGHSYTAKVTAPTCTAQGYTTHTCSRCSDTYKDTYVNAKGHTEAIDSAVAPTCTATGLTEGKHCSVCSAVLTAQEVILATGHNYTYTKVDDQTHTIGCKNCSLSETAPHSYEDGFCICGAEEMKEPVLETNWKIGHTLNLASDISVTMAISKASLSGFDMDTIYVLSERDVYEGNVKIGVKTIEIRPEDKGSYYYFTLTGLTAVHMNDQIRSVLYGTKDGQVHYSPIDEYSIATYAYAQMNKANAALKLKNLCAELLRYGSKAQIFKGYRTDALVDANLTEEQKAYLSDMEAVTFGNTNTTENIPATNAVQWLGKSLDLASKVSIKFIFSLGSYTGATEDLQMKVTYKDINGKDKELTISEIEAYNPSRGYYAFTLDSLLAAELRSVLTVQILCGDTVVSGTVHYAADTYGNGKTGALGDLCKALMAYSDSAKAFFD